MNDLRKVLKKICVDIRYANEQSCDFQLWDEMIEQFDCQCSADVVNAILEIMQNNNLSYDEEFMQRIKLMNINDFVKEFEFKIYKDIEENCYHLVDTQGANLGNIENAEINDLVDLVETLDSYVYDYVTVHEENYLLEEKGIDASCWTLEEIVNYYKKERIDYDDIIDYIINPNFLDVRGVAIKSNQKVS